MRDIFIVFKHPQKRIKSRRSKVQVIWNVIRYFSVHSVSASLREKLFLCKEGVFGFHLRLSTADPCLVLFCFF